MTPDESPAVQERITRQILANLRPVSPLPRTGILVAILLLIAAGIVAVGAWRQGTAGVRAESGSQSIVVLSLLAIALVAGAMLTAGWMVPAARYSAYPAAVLTAIVLSLLISIGLLFRHESAPNFLDRGIICWSIGMAYSSSAALLSVLILRRAAWLSPAALGTATGMCAGLTAMTVQEIYCPILSIEHIAAFHLGTVVSSALIGTILGLIVPHGLQQMKQIMKTKASGIQNRQRR
jgi:hypothetical protein